jgi:hypothetical protein
MEFPRPLSGFVDDPVDRPSGFIIQTELLRVLFDETGRSVAAVVTATPVVPSEGGLGEARAGNGQPGHESCNGSGEFEATHVSFLFAMSSQWMGGFPAAPTFGPSNPARGLRAYPPRNTPAIAR